ncbi:MAG: hypothetical protein E7773_11470 [Sphingomonas sp.]|uniref:hypothetical protein n=1 Tax=Sphingomonas sp. TaxID=28214 RepID=UPI0012136DF5|nr:hypothetical protein [Sphingomonas sp.]THD35074.1 MAG: hypothetical protein E7773_11470 [Sphingomonas sp.]
MSLVKSVAAGAAISLLIANVMHQEAVSEGGVLGGTHFTVLDQRVAWSWTIFVIATVVIWLLFKAVDAG